MEGGGRGGEKIKMMPVTTLFSGEMNVAGEESARHCGAPQSCKEERGGDMGAQVVGSGFRSLGCPVRPGPAQPGLQLEYFPGRTID